MSGGSMKYFYQQVESVSFNLNTPERKAFFNHLQKVAKALHDIEWVDSSDYGEGDENKAIMECISRQDVLLAAIESAETQMNFLGFQIKTAKDLLEELKK